MTDLTHDELRALCTKISVIEGWQHDELVNDTLALAKATLSLLDEVVRLRDALTEIKEGPYQAHIYNRIAAEALSHKQSEERG
ncbi:hypothetical protein LCGC14_2656950 [marine sediment metagenome]|uniref:Uncharacterized protein n=1 Tax=marine sediment metagenome TaxID=412755 RepID=A0A0F8ZT87_9ZZZZ